MKTRFAAKMLFQYRAIYRGETYKLRTVEERIAIFLEKSAEMAYAKAERYGRNAQFDLVNEHGARIFFEFVGILDFEELGVACDDNEVWYDIKRMKTPMERKGQLIPGKAKLLSRVTGVEGRGASGSRQNSKRRVGKA